MKCFGSLAVLHGRILVNVADCRRCPCMPAAQMSCSCILHNSASQLWIMIISLLNYYCYYYYYYYSVPGGSDGPSGVLICSENYITYKNLGDQPDIRMPIPRRRVSAMPLRWGQTSWAEGSFKRININCSLSMEMMITYSRFVWMSLIITEYFSSLNNLIQEWLALESC